MNPRTGREMVRMIIMVVLIIAVVVLFSVQNAAPVAVSFLFWRFDASLAIIIFISLLAGMLIGLIVSSWTRMRRAKTKGALEEVRNEGPHRPG